MEEFWEEMRRREREEEEGEARPQKSKMWRVRGKQRAGGTGAATLPLHPLYAMPHVSLSAREEGVCQIVRTETASGISGDRVIVVAL